MGNRIVIIGAGPIGLCLSLSAVKQGLDVDLVERRSVTELAAPSFDGREIALTHASIRLLRDLGVWQYIPSDEIAPVGSARIMDANDPGFTVDGAAFGHDRLGVLVSHHVIRAAAWKAAAAEPRIRVHTGVSIDAVACNAATATARLAGDHVLAASLLIAADGRFSETRRAMGIPVRMHEFGASMLVCRMRHTGSNDRGAWEWFGHGQTRALLPLAEHLSSVVLTVPDAEAQALMQSPPDAFAADVASRYEGRLGAMSLASTIHRYPLIATWARRFIAPRFALAGDAAVGMHPVTAHGFNLGLASVEHLAQAAGDGLRRYGDPAHPALLARYQRRQRMSSALLFSGTAVVAGLFTSERALAQPVRRGIMRLGRKLPLLRRALAASLLDESTRAPSIPRHLQRMVDVLRPRLGVRDAST